MPFASPSPWRADGPGRRRALMWRRNKIPSGSRGREPSKVACEAGWTATHPGHRRENHVSLRVTRIPLRSGAEWPRHEPSPHAGLGSHEHPCATEFSLMLGRCGIEQRASQQHRTNPTLALGPALRREWRKLIAFSSCPLPQPPPKGRPSDLDGVFLQTSFLSLAENRQPDDILINLCDSCILWRPLSPRAGVAHEIAFVFCPPPYVIRGIPSLCPNPHPSP
jgi:hypothetical protein